jgi:hypothetical protein
MFDPKKIGNMGGQKQGIEISTQGALGSAKTNTPPKFGVRSLWLGLSSSALAQALAALF